MPEAASVSYEWATGPKKAEIVGVDPEGTVRAVKLGETTRLGTGKTIWQGLRTLAVWNGMKDILVVT